MDLIVPFLSQPIDELAISARVVKVFSGDQEGVGTF